jgi:hypothetical protein
MAVLPDGTLAAHWLEKSGDRSYDYDVRVALSRDGGTTWTDDIIPHRDGVHAEHGFVSMFPLPAGNGAGNGDADRVAGAAGNRSTDLLGLVWLDGRETVHNEPMTLRFTTLDATGRLGEEVVLDASVCDCCQTGAARTSDGLVVVYRGRTDDEVRDIRVVRRGLEGAAPDPAPGGWAGWSEPRTIHDDGWVIGGCPVNGPSIAAEDDRVVVAWFTGAPPGDRVLAAISHDGGASIGPPVRIDDGQGMGRVSVVMLDDGAALITWLERTGDGAEIRTRRLEDAGAGPSAPLATTDAARAAGFPRVVRHGDTLVFAWTQPGDPPGVRTAVATLGRLAAAAEPAGRAHHDDVAQGQGPR